MEDKKVMREFIEHYFKTNPDKDYWDCTRALVREKDIDFTCAFTYVSQYATEIWIPKT